jgi:hypothetical protein
MISWTGMRAAGVVVAQTPPEAGNLGEGNNCDFAHRTLVLTSRPFDHLKLTSSAEFLPGRGVHFHGAASARNSSGNSGTGTHP